MTTTIHGDHLTGWHWTCECGQRSRVGSALDRLRQTALRHEKRHLGAGR